MIQFDPNNKIVQLCAKGMESNGEEATSLFMQAWNEAENDTERFAAAHYVARVQDNVADKLNWDIIALEIAQRIDTDEVKGAFPSLYLNIAKCHEDLGELQLAKAHYENALIYTEYLLDDGYGDLIRRGILSGLERVS